MTQGVITGQGRTRQRLPRPGDLEYGDRREQPVWTLGVLALLGLPGDFQILSWRDAS